MAVERSRSLRRALGLLEALGTDDIVAAGGCGVTELAALTGGEKSQVSRVLATLADGGFVDRDVRTRRYRLGWQMFALAARAGDQRLLNAAGPVLVRLVREIGESSHLSVLRGNDVLTLLTESPLRAVQAVSWIGRLAPATSTSSGRALLLDHDREQLAAMFGSEGWPAATAKSPRDVDDLLGRITLARAAGYARVEEESELGLVAVAAPVRAASGRIVAAVNISAPRFRLGRRLARAGAAVAAAAADLTAALGRPEPALMEEAFA
ncbi:MAG: IclR family transcriptional regulator [Geodermatophilaceae bacterium]|nr:IclR family transcriptional regulator [Geodermatophilaceae bacterium]